MSIIEPDESWISRKYEQGEVNTKMCTVLVLNPFGDGEDCFLQGHDAEIAIRDIHQIWLNDDVTQQEAFNCWISNNFGV